MKTASGRILRSPDKVAYLTFDDGPMKNTPRILSILARHQVKGTFFVVGMKGPFAMRMYRTIRKQGHSIGHHSYSHRYERIYSSKKAFMADFTRLERHLQQAGDIRTRLFRFPGGSQNKIGYEIGGAGTMKGILAEVRARGYRIYDWNVDSGDSLLPRPSSRQIVRKVLAESVHFPNYIILLHDFSDASVVALPAIVRGLKKRGFRFDTLSAHPRQEQILRGRP